jgi:hypothetical protein
LTSIYFLWSIVVHSVVRFSDATNKDIKLGIDLCKRQTLLITLDPANLLKEMQGYSYKKSKDGGVLDEPVGSADHLVGAMRYAVYGLVDRFGFATARPRETKAPVCRF